MSKYQKLKGKIVEKFGTQERFAEEISRTQQTVTNKLSGKTSFSLDDVVLWKDALEIADDEISEYFFAK